MPNAELARDSQNHPIQAFYIGPIQSVAVGAGSLAISNAVDTKMVIIHADADCYVAVGESPTADSSTGFPLAAGAYIFLRTVPGKTKFAAIQRTGSDSGTFWVIEGN